MKRVRELPVLFEELGPAGWKALGGVGVVRELSCVSVAARVHVRQRSPLDNRLAVQCSLGCRAGNLRFVRARPAVNSDRSKSDRIRHVSIRDMSEKSSANPARTRPSS